MKKPGTEVGAVPSGRRIDYLNIAFFIALALLAILVLVTYLGDIELASLANEERSAFERNVDEQSSSLNRVIFAVGDLLLYDAQSSGRPDFDGLVDRAQALVNHSGIPSIVEPAFLASILEDDPLFLVERVAAANERYHSRVETLGKLLEEARNQGDSPAGRAALDRFLSMASDFRDELRDDSSLFIQVAGAYHAANRHSLGHIQSHIGSNLIQLSILAALLLVVSILYFRSRALVERELHSHRDHLAELVATRTEELGAANQRLREALGEKEMLIKEVYHRVKNNLSMVAGLISLQQGDARTGNVDEAFEKLSQRLRAISLIHEKLYRSDDLSHIAFGDYMRDLCGTLIGSLSADPVSVSLELEAPELSLSPDILIPLGLIATELVTNSLKYAFHGRRKGRIRVVLEDEGKDLVLSIGDDGTPPADRSVILESSSLGAVLVQGLVRQIGGTLELDLSGGTRAIIRFPRSGAAA